MSDNAEFVKRMTDAFTAGDRDTVLAMFAPDIVVREAPSLPWGGDHHGPDGFRRLHEIMDPLWTERVVEFRFHEAGDDLVVLHECLEITGTRTGRSMELWVVDLIRLRDGKVAEIDVFYKDVHAVLDVLGA